ncbi:MAG: LacI family DNA-binding transcriptional regulator [Brevinema sp.]
MGKISIRDVASKAGVSISAVSLAYNKPYQLSEATRKKILAVAEEIGYTPSSKHLTESKLIVIAIPADQALKQFVSTFTYSIIQKFSEHHFNPISFSYKNAEDYAEQLKAITNKEPVEGIVAVVNDIHMNLKKSKIPMVVVSANTSGENIDIGFDFMSDIEDILSELQQQKKDNVAIVTSNLLFEDIYIQNYMKIFGQRFQEYFKKPFSTQNFCLLHESRKDGEIIQSFYDTVKPDSWIIVGDYALSYIQNVLHEELEGFVIMEEGKSYIKISSSKLVVLERPNSQIINFTVSTLLSLIANNESSPSSKKVLFSKKIY